MTKDAPIFAPEEVELIRTIVASNCPEAMEFVERLEQLSGKEIQVLDIALAREFAQHGLDDSDIPTAYGQAVEWLLDRLKYLNRDNI